MNNIELQNILEKNVWVPHYYIVTSCDTIPRIKDIFLPAAIIINEEKSDKPGTHWQSIYIEDGKPVAEFFCSLGKQITDQTRYHFEKDGFRIISNTRGCLQNPLIPSCGLWALDFIMCRSWGISYVYYLNRFAPYNFDFNEKEVRVHWTRRGIDVLRFKPNVT